MHFFYCTNISDVKKTLDRTIGPLHKCIKHRPWASFQISSYICLVSSPSPAPSPSPPSALCKQLMQTEETIMFNENINIHKDKNKPMTSYARHSNLREISSKKDSVQWMSNIFNNTFIIHSAEFHVNISIILHNKSHWLKLSAKSINQNIL